jgi:hypothetical protein
MPEVSQQLEDICNGCVEVGNKQWLTPFCLYGPPLLV